MPATAALAPNEGSGPGALHGDAIDDPNVAAHAAMEGESESR